MVKTACGLIETTSELWASSLRDVKAGGEPLVGSFRAVLAKFDGEFT